MERGYAGYLQLQPREFSSIGAARLRHVSPTDLVETDRRRRTNAGRALQCRPLLAGRLLILKMAPRGVRAAPGSGLAARGCAADPTARDELARSLCARRGP